MGNRTALYEKHVAANGKIVDFAGWDMPLHYGSQLEEHKLVREDAGMFDVSHMAVTDLKGEGVHDFLRLLIANDVARLTEKGKALYSCMLTTDGTVIDDLIVYYVEDGWYRVVSNAGTREKDMKWIRGAAETMGNVEIIERSDLSIIAVQGPKAKEKVYTALGEAVREACSPLKYFYSARIGELFIATTGYTGEEGFEIILPSKAAPFTWDQLLEAGVRPAGLGARDTLRLEAGMALYGNDMSETTTPLETGLAWTVVWEPQERRFIGRDALEAQKERGLEHRLVGVVLEDKGVLRRHQEIEFEGLGKGEITSGGFAPTLNMSIGLASVPVAVQTGSKCKVLMRGRELNARVVKYPFVRNGKSCLA
ncbi:MAG: glycine cleavage system aminomethyltransferase GcvT [Gammaproteobacteria bacterium]|nr:glycine cleavage system aminomethyltransferase GcvT [Gammaproteobacteria bacterium]